MKKTSRELLIAAAMFAVATPAMAVDTDDQLIEHVRQAVIQHHLYAGPDCMKHQIIRNSHPQVDGVDILDRQTNDLATTVLDPDRLQHVRLK